MAPGSREGGRSKGDRNDPNSKYYDNGTGPEREEDSREVIDAGRNDPNSKYYDNGTGPWPWEESDDERRKNDPSNPDGPNYEG